MRYLRVSVKASITGELLIPMESVPDNLEDLYNLSAGNEHLSLAMAFLEKVEDRLLSLRTSSELDSIYLNSHRVLSFDLDPDLDATDEEV